MYSAVYEMVQTKDPLLLIGGRGFHFISCYPCETNKIKKRTLFDKTILNNYLFQV